MTRIIQRNDLSTNWTANNPILAIGEVGWETDTKKFKLGDGATAWTSLAYAGAGESELDKYLSATATDSTVTLSANNKSLKIDAPTIEVGENLVDELGANSNLYLKQDTVEAGTNVTIEKTSTGVKINSTGGGETIDAYTKAETDGLLAKKENTFEPTVPLKFTSHPAVIKTGVIIANNSITNSDTGWIYQEGSAARFYLSGNLASKVVVPYKFGQVVKYPAGSGGVGGGIAFGYPTADGTGFVAYGVFLPCSMFYSGSNINKYSGGFVLASPSPLSNNTVNYYPNPAEGANAIISSNGEVYNYAQLTGGADDDFVALQNSFIAMNDSTQRVIMTSVFRDSNLYTGAIDEMKSKITHVLYLFGTANNTYSIENVQMFDIAPRMSWGEEGYRAWEANLGDNILDLTSDGGTVSLDLNVGSGLSVVDNKLVADNQIPSNNITTSNLVANLPIGSSTQEGIVQVDGTTIVSNDGVISAIGGGSSAPENMVTTDTEQNITGLKTFGEAGVRVSNSNFLGIVQTRNDNGNLVLGAMKNDYTNNNIYTFSSGMNNQEAQIEIGSNIALHTGNAFKQIKVTQAEYDALTTKDTNTMYIIIG